MTDSTKGKHLKAVGVSAAEKRRKSAKSMKEKNTAQRAENMRARISDSRQLSEILSVLKSVADLDKKFAKIPRHRWTPEVKRKIDGLLSAKKLRLDGHMKLLNKVCGDQRSTGLDGDGDDLPELTLRVVRNDADE